jgi:hypothetical protein
MTARLTSTVDGCGQLLTPNRYRIYRPRSTEQVKGVPVAHIEFHPQAASRRYASGIESAIASVVGALTGAGHQLLSTVAVITSTDDKSSDLFKTPIRLCADKPHWYGVDGGVAS